MLNILQKHLTIAFLAASIFESGNFYISQVLTPLKS